MTAAPHAGHAPTQSSMEVSQRKQDRTGEAVRRYVNDQGRHITHVKSTLLAPGHGCRRARSEEISNKERRAG